MKKETKTPKKAVKKAAPKKAAKKAVKKSVKKKVEKAPKAVKKEKKEVLWNEELIKNIQFEIDGGLMRLKVYKKDGTSYSVLNMYIIGSDISCGVRQMYGLPKNRFWEVNSQIFNKKCKNKLEILKDLFLKTLETHKRNTRFTFVVCSDYVNDGNEFMDSIATIVTKPQKNRNSSNKIKVWIIK